MLIVIVIIGIITSMTFYLGTDRIKELDRQSVKDQFVDAFQMLVGQARTSSYYYATPYTTMHVAFLS